MKYLHKYGLYFCFLIVVFLFLFIVASGNQKLTATVSNVNNIKSVPATSIYNAYNSVINLKKKETTLYPTFQEAIRHVSSGNVSFVGKLTGYGPDCKGCSGKTACKPNQDVRGGNIYYSDSTYGKIRIVAADKNIPCGSIIKINNIKIYSEPIMVVVLDRGKAIKENHLDLLFSTEKNMGGFSTQSDIQFDIIRWGF